MSYLKLRVGGIDPKGFELNGGRQSLKGDMLEILKEDVSGYKYTPLPVPGMDEYLKDTPFIQSGDSRIVGLAREITGGEKDALIAAGRLWEWVFKNVKKAPSITIPSALDVLKLKRGDCNEHTSLFTALARAVGLPARINAGLVYQEGSFFYHAWPEVFVGQWLSVDPTLGQFPADAGHVRLVTGDLDKQIILLKAINNISLEGVEYRE